MKLTPKNKQLVQEAKWGIYVWKCPDGEVLGDGDGNIMNVFCMEGDIEAMAALQNAAKHYGFTEGHAEFWPGRRRVTDEEFEAQQARAAAGLVPDELDVGVHRDWVREQRNK